MELDRSRRMEVKPEVVFLGKLVQKLSEGRLRLPRFQRPFVWQPKDILALLDSVRRAFPIGTILVWETEEEVTSTDMVGPVELPEMPSGFVSYVLDGQQRLSSLAGSLLLKDEQAPFSSGINWRIYHDLTTGEFVSEPKGALPPRLFPVRHLLSTSGFVSACRDIVSELGDHAARPLLDKADRLANAFRDYTIPFITVRDADLNTAVTVFARLNRSGRKMTEDQMVSALTYEGGKVPLSARLDELQGELRSSGFGGLDRIFVLRSVLAAMNRDIYAKDFANLMARPELRDSLHEGFEIAAEAIRRAVQFLKDLGVVSDRLLPYGLQVVMLADFFRFCPQPDPGMKEKIARWFWVTSFTCFFGGINSSRVREVQSEVCQVAKGERDDFRIVTTADAAEPFPPQFDGRSARVRAFLLYLVSLGPERTDGRGSLDIADLLAKQGPLALGYVAGRPTGEVAGRPTGEVAGRPTGEVAGKPANRLFVEEDLRGRALARFEKVADDETLDRVLQSHGFPPGSCTLVRRKEQDGLLAARSECLIEGERAFMEQKRVQSPQQRVGDYTLADSETSDDLEEIDF
ncbi:MAG: DUF262 domain-containing protein [Candidatus Schekmanbacteria bacterium]|nr:DUF262 domain-containing protein [Candidatus Schekmanbacteria bacterium]